MSADIVTRMKQRVAVLCLSMMGLVGSLFASEPAVTTVILIRHAEKVDASANPGLSAAGQRRAQSLERLLRDVPIAAVYTTPFTRTRHTAQPAAAGRGLSPTEITADTKLAENTAARVLDHSGKAVLVVGHSNTIPDTIRALGFKDVPAIEDTEYDRLFICTLVDGKPVSMLTLRY